MFDLSGRTALVTGASGGIGGAIARALHAQGAELMLTGTRADALQSLAAELGGNGTRVEVIVADLSVDAERERVASTTLGFGQPAEVLVNNAGLGLYGAFTQIPWEKEKHMLDVDIGAVVHLTKLLLPQMLERRSGYVLNVASIAAFLPGPGMAVYYASKAFVLSFSEALHHELAGRGIRVTALCPGPVETEFQARSGMKLPEAAKLFELPPGRVAEIGYAALMRGQRVAIAGLGNKLAVALMRLVPNTLLLRLVDRRARGL